MAGIQCCRDCTERHIGCHGTCETYLQEKKEYNAVMQEIRNKNIPYTHNTDGTMWTPPADRTRKSKKYKRYSYR